MTVITHNRCSYKPTATVPVRDEDAQKPVKQDVRKIEILEPSLFRRISVLFWSLINDMWVSAYASLFGKQIEVELEAGIEGSPIYSAIQSLRTQTTLSSMAVDQYCQFLTKTDSSALYVPNCLIKDGVNLNVADFPSRGSFSTVFIPIVLKERFVDHIVGLLITHDTDDHVTIEFYDSKGLTIADRANESLVNNPDMTLGRLVAQLADKYADKAIIRVKENTTKHQWDSHNCGVDVSRWLAARLTGIDYNPNDRDIRTWRTNMIDDLMPTFDKALDDERAMKDIDLVALDDIDDELEKENTPLANLSVPSGSFVDVPLD